MAVLLVPTRCSQYKMQDGRRTGTTATAYTGGTMTVEIPTNEPLAAGPLEA